MTFQLRGHQCLTQDTVLDLMEHPVPPKSPGVIFCALLGLSQCERCPVTHGDERKRTLYLCFGHYHSRCLGFEDETLNVSPPCALWKLEATQVSQATLATLASQSRFASLCVAWAAGHDIAREDWQAVQRTLACSPHGRHHFDALYQQLADLWLRYPDGRLADDFLQSLVHNLDRICPPA